MKNILASMLTSATRGQKKPDAYPLVVTAEANLNSELSEIHAACKKGDRPSPAVVAAFATVHNPAESESDKLVRWKHYFAQKEIEWCGLITEIQNFSDQLRILCTVPVIRRCIINIELTLTPTIGTPYSNFVLMQHVKVRGQLTSELCLHVDAVNLSKGDNHWTVSLPLDNAHIHPFSEFLEVGKGSVINNGEIDLSSHKCRDCGVPYVVHSEIQTHLV